jgi:hypothetical protein
MHAQLACHIVDEQCLPVIAYMWPKGVLTEQWHHGTVVMGSDNLSVFCGITSFL